jgi:hypothetical protein
MSRGKPRKFKSEKEFINKFIEYIEYCKTIEYLPNVAGFARYCDIDRWTFYAQEDYYPNTFKKVQTILEDETINAKNINDTFKIFYMKNKFDYKDRQEIDNINNEQRVVIVNDLGVDTNEDKS